MTPKEIFEIVEPYASEALAQLVQMSPKRGPLETKGHILKIILIYDAKRNLTTILIVGTKIRLYCQRGRGQSFMTQVVLFPMW